MKVVKVSPNFIHTHSNTSSVSIPIQNELFFLYARGIIRIWHSILETHLHIFDVVELQRVESSRECLHVTCEVERSEQISFEVLLPGCWAAFLELYGVYIPQAYAIDNNFFDVTQHVLNHRYEVVSKPLV